MWNKRKRKKRDLYSRHLTTRLMLIFLLSLVGMTLLLWLGLGLWHIIYDYFLYGPSPHNFVTATICRVMVYLEIYVGRNTVIPVLAGAMCIAIVWALLRAATGYVDVLVDAASALAEPGEEPVRLPEMLSDAQAQLELARERSLRTAMFAREAEQRKNDLVVYLAHDLKTPLTSVIGYLTLLRDEPDLPAELRARYTGIALDKAERLESLINEFFDITRFSLTTLTLEKERVNLSRMVEQIASEFDPVLGEKDLTWELDVAPGVEILCDADKLARVFDNLIRNAVNYSYPHTQIALSLRGEGDRAVVQVQNHGRTIPPEKLGRIFEQFFRLDSSRGTATGGAGLGLAIAREIVQAHGGSITAESADEQILFTVSLPL